MASADSVFRLVRIARRLGADLRIRNRVGPLEQSRLLPPTCLCLTSWSRLAIARRLPAGSRPCTFGCACLRKRSARSHLGEDVSDVTNRRRTATRAPSDARSCDRTPRVSPRGPSAARRLPSYRSRGARSRLCDSLAGDSRRPGSSDRAVFTAQLRTACVPHRGSRLRSLSHPFGARPGQPPSQGRCPALAFAQRHSRQRARRARSPSSRVCTAEALGTRSLPSLCSGLRGAQPGGDPGPFDRCLQLTDSIFNMIARLSRHTPRRTSPRDTGALGSRRSSSLRRAGRGRVEAFSSSRPSVPAYL